jgi:hypothetical protein
MSNGALMRAQDHVLDVFERDLEQAMLGSSSDYDERRPLV